MVPGLSEADCQVAAFHYRQLVNEGQREQISAGARPASSITWLMSGAVRQQIGAILVTAGQHLQGMQAGSGESHRLTSTGGASASA